MKSSADKLVMMANQIANNLALEPDPAGATAEHIQLFWAPQMKAMWFAYPGTALTPVAAAARARLQAMTEAARS